jgi:hypothetical protein
MTHQAAAPPWLETGVILAVFGEQEDDAVAGYRRFVAGGKGQTSPWEQLKRQVFPGSEDFVDAMQRGVSGPRHLREVPQAKPRRKALSLDEYAGTQASRDEVILAGYASGGYRLREIGGHLGPHDSRVSKIARRTVPGVKESPGKT